MVKRFRNAVIDILRSAAMQYGTGQYYSPGAPDDAVLARYFTPGRIFSTGIDLPAPIQVIVVQADGQGGITFLARCINQNIDRLLYGGFLAIERALHVLGILDNEGNGLETYGTCCTAYLDKHTSQTQGWSPKDAVVAANDLVTVATGRDPRDPANWVDPVDADWVYVTQICAPGDAAR